jgi:hypothetical protein
MRDGKKTEKNGLRDGLVLHHFSPSSSVQCPGIINIAIEWPNPKNPLPVSGVKESGTGWVQGPEERLQTGESPSQDGIIAFAGTWTPRIFQNNDLRRHGQFPEPLSGVRPSMKAI